MRKRVERHRKTERDVEYVRIVIFMMGALAPFSYLVVNSCNVSVFDFCITNLIYLKQLVLLNNAQNAHSR